MAETSVPSDTPFDYPKLNAFFPDETPLDPARRALLIDAVSKAMKSTMTARLPQDPLAREIRQTVEELKLYPPSLSGNKVAVDALAEALNTPKIRPIVEMVWDQLKKMRSPGGTILVDHL